MTEGRIIARRSFTTTMNKNSSLKNPKQELEKSGKFDKPIVTDILKSSKFYKAEDYHQDYHSKDPIRYKFYRSHAGRDQYLDKMWGHDREPKGLNKRDRSTAEIEQRRTQKAIEPIAV